MEKVTGTRAGVAKGSGIYTQIEIKIKVKIKNKNGSRFGWGSGGEGGLRSWNQILASPGERAELLLQAFGSSSWVLMNSLINESGYQSVGFLGCSQPKLQPLFLLKFQFLTR